MIYTEYSGTRSITHLEHRARRGLGAAKHDACLHAYRICGRKSEGIERFTFQG